jgi:hypothetical protein
MVLNCVKVKVKPESSFFNVGNKKKSAGARSGKWGGGEGISWESLPYLCSVNRHIVLVEEPLPGDKVGPFLPERLQKSLQGIYNVGRGDRHAPGDVIRVHHALIFKKREHHLLGTGGDDFRLDRAWHALLQPLHCLALGLRGMHGNCAFIHRDDPAKDAPPLFLHQLNEGGRSFHPLFHLVR